MNTSRKSKDMSDKEVKDLPPLPLIPTLETPTNPFKRHFIIQAAIDVSDHILSFFLYLLLGLLIGMSLNYFLL